VEDFNPKCYAGTIKKWRSWFKKNHKKENKVYLISYKKHTGKPSMSHKEAMEEAICFGWIDTTLKRIDESTFARCFVKRKENANWSRNTLSYAKSLIKQKRMTIYGLKAYGLGLKKLPHDHGRKENPTTPEDLELALDKNKLKEKFENLAQSYRKTYLYWLERAKRIETREKRIKIILEGVRNGKALFR